MKKWMAAFLSLFAIYTGVAYWLGVFAQDVTVERLAQTNNQDYTLDIDYQRGIYTSHIKISAQSTLNSETMYEVETRLVHGPLLWNVFSLGAASYDGQVTVSIWPELEPIHFQGAIGLTGNDTLHFHKAAQEIRIDNEQTIEFGMIDGSSSFQGDHAQTQIHIDGLSTRFDEGKLSLGHSSLSMNGSLQELAENMGSIEMQSEFFHVHDEDDRLLMQITGIESNTVSKLNAHDVFQGQFDASIDRLQIANLAQTFEGSIRTSYQFKGLQSFYDFFLKLEKASIANSAQGAVEPELYMKHAAKFLNPLRFDVKALEFKPKGDDGEHANISASIQFALEDKDYSVDILGILKGTRLVCDLVLPKSVAQTLYLDGWMQMIAMQGMATLEKDVYSSKIRMNDGDITINGQVLPLLK